MENAIVKTKQNNLENCSAQALRRHKQTTNILIEIYMSSSRSCRSKRLKLLRGSHSLFTKTSGTFLAVNQVQNTSGVLHKKELICC